MKKLYRSWQNRKIGGICGGLGDYYRVDPAFIRIIFIFLFFFSAGVPMLLCYLVLWWLIPLNPYRDEQNYRKLYRSRLDRKMAGICGGFARFFSLDSTLVRVVALILCLITGVLPLLFIYLIGIWIIDPFPSLEEEIKGS